MCQAQLLIVNKSSPLPEEAQPLLAALVNKYGLDPYTARQRLTGQGLGLFAKATREKLDKVATLLTEHGIGNCILDPTPPRFAPTRARGLEISSDQIRFATGDPPVVLERGDRVLAILADLTGTMVERNLKKLMVQTAYLGNGVASQLDEDETYKTVLHNQPVLDLYLLDEQQQVRQAVRLFAGRYDPNGLGELKTYSVAGNMDAIVQLARDYAGEFTLHTDFGLVDIPGCRLKKLETGHTPDKGHLTPLTRFGWLMVDREKQRKAVAQQTGLAVDLAAASVVLGAPAAVAIATATGQTIPGFEELAAEIQGSPEPKTPKSAIPRPTLPPPPELKPSRRHLLRKALSWSSGGILGGVLFLLHDFDLLFRTAHISLYTGALPALLSLVFGWIGFHHLRLKRHMENLPTSRIRSVAMGMVEVKGHARRKYALVSPMTHQSCVYYRLRKHRRDSEGHTWKEYSSVDCGPIPFDLEDDTGRLTIDPDAASIRTGHRHQGYPGQNSLLFAASGSYADNEMWIEEIIPEGTFIYVIGFARAAERAGSSLRDRTLAALRELKQNRHWLKRYDSDNDGRISEEEWQRAKEDVEQQVLRESLEEKQEARPQQAHITIGHPRSRSLPFIIAETESEAHLTRRFGITAGIFLALGLGLGIFTLVRLVHLFSGRI
ncbi:MAG: hypothetical protein P8X63_01430 [Desulfuromonadaceae bacterium]